MTTMNTRTAEPAPSGRNWFLDENGEPSDRSGPDLEQAEPIDQVIARLRPLRNGFSIDFWRACKDSGIDITLIVHKDGREDLRLGIPLDNQEALRKPRFEALSELLNSTARRHEQVLQLAYILGRFADNRPYTTAEEAVDELLRLRGRIWIFPNGELEESVPLAGADEEAWTGWPRLRFECRYRSTVHQKGMKEALIAIVRARGTLHDGSGCIVLRPSATAVS